MFDVPIESVLERMKNPPEDSTRLERFLAEAVARARLLAPCLNSPDASPDVIAVATGIVADAAISRWGISERVESSDPRVIAKQYPEFSVQYSQDTALYFTDDDVQTLRGLCSAAPGGEAFSYSPFRSETGRWPSWVINAPESP